MRTVPQLAKTGVMLESYYVNKLCSPTRTALLSGRYAYTLGQDDGVIVDGTPNDLQLNLLTIADRLQQGGWNTSAYGKYVTCGSIRGRLSGARADRTHRMRMAGGMPA